MNKAINTKVVKVNRNEKKSLTPQEFAKIIMLHVRYWWDEIALWLTHSNF